MCPKNGLLEIFQRILWGLVEEELTEGHVSFQIMIHPQMYTFIITDFDLWETIFISHYTHTYTYIHTHHNWHTFWASSMTSVCRYFLHTSSASEDGDF